VAALVARQGAMNQDELTIAAPNRSGIVCTGDAVADTMYFDNAATSFPKPDVVYRAMDNFARHIGGSGGRSSHRRALESASVVDSARESLCALLGAHAPECVCFGMNATEGLNIAIHGLAEPGCRVVTSTIEHNSVRRPVADLNRRLGCQIVTIGGDELGFWDARSVIAALTPQTACVILSWASNVTGALQDMHPVARACRDLGIPLVIDGAQICGSYPVDFKTLGAAALAFTGHKSLLGPQGTGGLLVNPEYASRIKPFKLGGSGTVSHAEEHPDNMPDKFEAGTLNCHGLSGLHAGAAFLLEHGVAAVRAHEMKLWHQFREGLREIGHVKVFGPDKCERAVSIVSITVEGMEPTDLGFLLDMRYGILTRSGLHCAPGVHHAIGTLPTGTVRFSLGFANTAAQIDLALDALAHIRERPKTHEELAASAVRAQ
jgi:cysteine desulfurase / selenocysteine lyase